MVSVLEQGGVTPNLVYRNWTTYNNTWLSNYFWRGAVSYVTGSHAFKAGINDSPGYQKTRTYSGSDLQYRFNNGVPNQITEFATPYEIHNILDHDLGIFAQDKWTISRLTLTGGVRFDYFATGFGEGHLYSGRFVPGRDVTFPEQDNLSWKDITPRMGAVYDVRGDGKTAVKVSLNKYLGGIGLNGIAQDPNPINTVVNNTTRSWTDANGNYVPDCNLTATGANGECGALAAPTFGQPVPTSTFDKDLTEGWGNRYYNWEFSTSVSHEIVPRVSMDVGYFRRWFGNFRVTDNLSVPASGYDQYTLTVPNDARLPNSGAQVTGLDLNPAYFGLTPSNFNTLSDKYGKMTDHWNGMDFTVNARLQNGMLLQGGVSTGRESVDACDVTSKIPELLLNSTGVNPNPLAPGFSGAGFNLQNVWLSPSNCANKENWQTQVKFVGIYMVPKIDVQLSGTYQDTPGPVLAANFVATNAYLAANSTLGRPLSGNAANTTINVIEPGTFYGDRVHLLDMRFSKAIRAGRTKTSVNFDIANLLNSNAVVTELYGYNLANTGAWRRPNDILSARFLKIGFNFEF